MSLRALLAVAALAVAAPAFAQSDQPAPGGQGQSQSSAWQQNRDAMRKACEADIKTYCSDQGQRPGQCLRQHAEQLSPDCKDAMAKMRSMMREHPQPQH